MNLTEKWPVLRLPVLGRPEAFDDERLLKLFWNRAELKKELQSLDDELRQLQGRIKQQEGANARLQEQLEQLEVMLGTPAQGPDVLVHFSLKNLWRECRAQLEQFASDLRRQRQEHERKRQLAEFQQDRTERLGLADDRLRESATVVELERARLDDGEGRIASLRSFWHYFRRRELAFELEAQRARLADAERHLTDMQEARRTIEKEQNATGDIIITMDGDGTYPPESITLLLYILFEEDVDFISARRWRSKSLQRKSPIRIFGNIILSFTMAALYLCYIVDSQSGMWVFKKNILPNLKLSSDGMALSEEIKIEAFANKNIKTLEIPIYYGERVGTSKLNIWRDGILNLLFLFKKRLGFV